MQQPLQVTFRDMEPSDFVRQHIEKRVAKLEHVAEQITSCKVVVEARNRGHHRHGSLFHVMIDVTVPGAEYVVGRKPEDGQSNSPDLYAGIDVAFDHMRRMLDEAAEKRSRKAAAQKERVSRSTTSK